ncbi:MAG: hypothetical protein D6834_00825, partial [Aquificota bacterium]
VTNNNTQEIHKEEVKQENKKEEKLEIKENLKVETITGKGKVIDVYKKNDTIKGKINIDNKVLEFETKYDPDIMLLLEDARKYNLPLTFVIKKEGNKAYIEEVK